MVVLCSSPLALPMIPTGASLCSTSTYTLLSRVAGVAGVAAAAAAGAAAQEHRRRTSSSPGPQFDVDQTRSHIVAVNDNFPSSVSVSCLGAPSPREPAKTPPALVPAPVFAQPDPYLLQPRARPHTLSPILTSPLSQISSTLLSRDPHACQSSLRSPNLWSAVFVW